MKEISVHGDVTQYDVSVTVDPEKVLKALRNRFLRFHKLPDDLTVLLGAIGTFEEDHRGGLLFTPHKGKIPAKQRKVIHAFHTLLKSLDKIEIYKWKNKGDGNKMNNVVNFKFGLGDQVKDRVSGFTGIVTGRIEYFTGCLAYQVTPEALNKDGEPHKSSVLNENGLDLIEAGKVKTGREVAIEEQRPKGGPCDQEISDPSGR